ncbi:PEGA domain-containing protein [Patescibacteria group bacterium]|nr:PEGA domain-containing protein [Patescibacteria group bacterium]
MKKQLLIPLLTLSILLVATILVILYGKGYRFSFERGKPDLSGTGLLVATSIPDGAQVFINGHLTTATDNTINLAPGSYEVKITKEGYFPWNKKIIVKKEVVAKADAYLFPTAPKLENITSIGVSNPVLDPTQTKIAYNVSSQSALTKNGVYVLDMSARPILTLQSAATQIADDTLGAFSSTLLSWSPDASQLLATISGRATYLLNARGFNQNPQDITETIAGVNSTWSKQENDKEKARLSALSSKTRALVVNNFNVIGWSLDETKVLYKAKASTELPIIISPRMIGANSTEEQRSIKKDSVYTYDLKEDRNYKILDSLETTSKPLSWFPDSKHLVYVNNQKVEIMEYDGQNITTVYAGPFVNDYVFSWPDATKIVILTNLGNPNIPANLYTIVLK